MDCTLDADPAEVFQQTEPIPLNNTVAKLINMKTQAGRRLAAQVFMTQTNSASVVDPFQFILSQAFV